ncbi:50S ribosomal protein L4 [Citroniella saccharovorans]|uniref:50S ribosomal protein L4 n=1 Tax=Citroniella saccharovorans TaxID=2053367 RepID=UPI00361BF2BB
MTKVNVLNTSKEKLEEIELSESVFGAEVKEHAVYEAVKNTLANRRQGTKSALTRAEVRGGGRKPWRQKGTGRARQGSIRSPQWRGGGVVFAPKPRDYSYSIPKKVKRAALKSVLSQKALDGEVIVLDSLSMDKISTKSASEILKKLEIKSCCIVTKEKDETVIRSFRNIPKVDVLSANNLNVYDILNREFLLVTKDALDVIEEVYA